MRGCLGEFAIDGSLFSARVRGFRSLSVFSEFSEFVRLRGVRDREGREDCGCVRVFFKLSTQKLTN